MAFNHGNYSYCTNNPSIPYTHRKTYHYRISIPVSKFLKFPPPIAGQVTPRAPDRSRYLHYLIYPPTHSIHPLILTAMVPSPHFTRSPPPPMVRYYTRVLYMTGTAQATSINLPINEKSPPCNFTTRKRPRPRYMTCTLSYSPRTQPSRPDRTKRNKTEHGIIPHTTTNFPECGKFPTSPSQLASRSSRSDRPWPVPIAMEVRCSLMN
ncbi:hypothetical protein HOY82DRAFT_593995 [Tuber indicum]|nr:hypothetical protein HOY82DRAFT_593995 [Tuber indicum]